MTKKERLIKKLGDINAYYCELILLVDGYSEPFVVGVSFQNFNKLKETLNTELNDDLINYVEVNGENVYHYRIKKYTFETLKDKGQN